MSNRAADYLSVFLVFIQEDIDSLHQNHRVPPISELLSAQLLTTHNVLASLLDRYLLSRLDLVQIWEWGGKIAQIEESIVTTGCKLIKSAPTATSSFKVDSSLI